MMPLGAYREWMPLITKSVTEAALRQSKDKLSKLRHALHRVDEEDFGLCKRCGKAIPVMRVALMPQSPYCVNCAR